MRWFALAVWLAACGFEHGAATSDPTDASRPIDAPADVRAIVDAPSAPPCHASDASLVWCLELDEPNLATAATALDSSGLHHDPSIANVATTTRSVPASSQAITLTTSSTLSLAKPSDFDLQSFTITAWVRRSSNSELGIVDTSKQYTMSITNTDHTVECALSNGSQTVSYDGSAQTGMGEWDLVACTYDQSEVCEYSFRNGSASGQSGCSGRNQTTPTIGTLTTVGSWADGTSHFVGDVDQVRLYSRALTQQEICTAGGLTGC
ncbi:MAG: LamG domain-containing protein [Acidobacteriota bacterium]